MDQFELSQISDFFQGLEDEIKNLNKTLTRIADSLEAAAKKE